MDSLSKFDSIYQKFNSSLEEFETLKLMLQEAGSDRETILLLNSEKEDLISTIEDLQQSAIEL